MARPHGTTGSLRPTFVPARAVALAVRRPYAYTLAVRLPTALRAPSRASGTLSEATAPVKLPTCHGPRRCDRLSEIVSKARVVFHCCLRPSYEPGPQRLPPMLRRPYRQSMTSYSKGAWGLFVLSRVIGILTDTAISPSLRRRQCPSRYAIRAGRNLPDKEFRYLRTVIVTAAVYRGFGSLLRLAADLFP